MIECDRMNMMMTMRNGSCCCCCLCCVIVLGDDDDDENNGNDGTRVILSRVVDGVGVDDALVVGNNLYIGDDVCMYKEMCELFGFWILRDSFPNIYRSSLSVTRAGVVIHSIGDGPYLLLA